MICLGERDGSLGIGGSGSGARNNFDGAEECVAVRRRDWFTVFIQARDLSGDGVFSHFLRLGNSFTVCNAAGERRDDDRKAPFRFGTIDDVVSNAPHV